MVSVIITTKNRIELLKNAVKSVQNQTYKNIELIVVDDSSSDGTKEWCKNQSFKYIRIEGKESKGGNYARNIGIKNSKGEYVAFLDDDDLWLPEKIEKQIELIKNKDCGIVYCRRFLNILQQDGCETVIENKKLPMGDLREKVFESIFTTTSALLLKKNLLEEVGLFDEKVKFWQEYELIIRLAQKSKIFYVEEPLIVYLINNNDTQRLTNKFYGWIDSVNYIKNKHKELFKKISINRKRKFYGFFYREAYVRSKSNGLKMKTCLYLFKSILFSPIHTIKKAISNLK